MKLTLNYILLIASLFLYAISSYGVNMAYIYMALVIYLIGFVDIVKEDVKIKNYLNFNLIFLVSFFSVTYLFPIAVLDTDLDIRMYQAKFVDFNYITQAVTLSTIAITVYYLGYKMGKARRVITGNSNGFQLSWRYKKVASGFNLTLALIVVANSLIYIRNNAGSINITEAPFLNQIYEVSLAISLICSRPVNDSSGFKDFFSRNKSVLIVAGFVTLIFLYVGDRGLPIQLMIGIFAAYSFYYSKLRLSSLAIIGVVGILAMFALRVTRNSSESISNAGVNAAANATQQTLEGQSVVVLLSDLYGASQELCFGYEYKTKEGLSYPLQIVTLPFSPVPKLPTVLNQVLFDKTPFELSSGYILNDYMSRYSDSAFGSHCVIDIYMKWGALGVIVFFYLFAYVLAVIENNSHRTLFGAVMWVLVTALALYMPRDSILDIIRPMFYAIVLIYVYRKMTSNRSIKLSA